MGYTPYTEHSSWVDGSDQRGVGKHYTEQLDYWLNYGHGGLAPYTGAFFIEHTISSLKSSKAHLKQLEREMKSKGHKVTIR